MNCKEAAALRESYEVNTLSPDSSKAYREQPLRCETCSEQLSDFANIFSQLVDDPFDVKDSVMKKNKDQEVPKKRPAWLSFFQRPAFAGGVIAGVGMLFSISSTFKSVKSAKLSQIKTTVVNKAVLLQDSRLFLKKGSLTLNGKQWLANMPGSESIKLHAQDHI